MSEKNRGETRTSEGTTGERTPGLSRWDGLIARMAGNIAAGLVCRRWGDTPVYDLGDEDQLERVGITAVKLAHSIIRAIEDGTE